VTPVLINAGAWVGLEEGAGVRRERHAQAAYVTAARDRGAGEATRWASPPVTVPPMNCLKIFKLI
jgi:hypothetical protein